MAYINLASSAKLARSNQLISVIGSSAKLMLYTGDPPASPDYPPTGTLLASLSLASPAGVASYSVQAAVPRNGGTRGVDGAQTLTGTTGSGIPFQVAAVVSGGSIVAIVSLAPGAYSVPPTDINNEPISGAGLVGASLSLTLTAQLSFNAITPANAIASGTAGYARIAGGTGAGIIDLDCGTSNTSVLLNTTQLMMGSPVTVTADLIVEG